MAGYLGIAVGGAVAVLLISLIVGKLVFKDTAPTERAIYVSAISWLIASAIAGFGMADGGSFKLTASLYYLPGAVLAFIFLRNSFQKQWVDEEEV